MRICAAADLHGSSIALSYIGYMAKEHKVDLILIAGDICAGSITRHFVKLLPEISKYSCCPIIITLGNHDLISNIEKYFPGSAEYIAGTKQLTKGSVVCLIEQSITFKNLNIWGSPYTNRYGDWSWTRDVPNMKFEIPRWTDILLTHSPAFSKGDHVPDGKNIGSEALLLAINNTPNLKLHVFGHAHADGGWEGRIGNTILRNCAMMTENLEINYKGLAIIDVKSDKKEYIQCQYCNKERRTDE